MKLILPSTVVFLTLVAALTLTAADAPPPTKPAVRPVLQSVLTDCISYQDKKLVVKFRTDDASFKSYIAASFTYPKTGQLAKAQVGETYLITFTPGEPPHNVKKAVLYDPANSPKEIPEGSMIGKVVGFKETDAAGKALDPQKQGVMIQFNQDEHVQAYFAKNISYTLYNPPKQEFKAGDVIKIGFGPDNRHTNGFAIIPK